MRSSHLVKESLGLANNERPQRHAGGTYPTPLWPINNIKTKLILSISLFLHLLETIDSATIVIQPNNKAATLIPGQPLHFECAQVGKRNPQFVW